MSREIHVRAFLFHGMELGDHGVTDRHSGRSPSALTPPAPVWIRADRQRPGAFAEHSVVASGQSDRLRRFDPPARDGQVRERAPRGLGEKTAVVDLDLGQGGERPQVDLLSCRRPWVELSRDPRREVAESVNRALAGKHEGGQLGGIEPLEGCALERSVVQVEPVDIDPRSHFRPRKRQRPLRGAAFEPTARCRRVVEATLHSFTRHP